MTSEDRIQAECVKWANNEYPELRGFGVCHIPNGGLRNKIEANKLKAMGVRKGFADLIVILPSGTVFFIEMKDDKGKQSEEQVKFQEFVQQRGIPYYLIRTLEDFQTLIKSKMKNIPK